MELEEIASEIHRFITGRKQNKKAVQKIARILGKSQQTVYDCLYGRIKINLNFIKAAVEATGDPDIKAFLEPEGWALYEKPALGEITDNFEKEVNDIFLAVTHLSVSIKDAIKNRKLDRQKLAHLKRLRAEVARQTDEVMLFAEEIYSKKC